MTHVKDGLRNLVEKIEECCEGSQSYREQEALLKALAALQDAETALEAAEDARAHEETRRRSSRAYYKAMTRARTRQEET